MGETIEDMRSDSDRSRSPPKGFRLMVWLAVRWKIGNATYALIRSVCRQDNGN